MSVKLLDVIAYKDTLKVPYVEVRNFNISSCSLNESNNQELFKKISELRGEEKSYSMWCIKFVNCEIDNHINTASFKDCRFENCFFRNAEHISFNRCSFSNTSSEPGQSEFNFCKFDNCRFENDNYFGFRLCEMRNIKGSNDEIEMYQCLLDDKPISGEIEFT